MALAEGAGLLVVGLSERWREEGLGARARAARRGAAGADGARAPRHARRAGMAPARVADALRLVADGGRAHERAIDPGDDFAGYRIESLIGRGGMGVVYRATDLSLERPVALKLIAPEYAENERFRRRFLKEPRLAAALDHPNVVPIYEAREHDGQLYLAMRYVAGQRPQDARSRARDRWTPERALRDRSRRSPTRSTPPTAAASSTATSSRPTSCSTRTSHAYLTDFGITKQLGSRRRPRPSRWSGRSTTWRPSGSAASTSTAAATSTRSPACSTSA